jgi:hypothetical protein
MKNIFLGLLFIATFGVVTSCDDFLDEKPRTNYTTNIYFTKASQAESVVNKLYKEGAPGYYQSQSVFWGMQIMYGPFLSGLYDNMDYKGQATWIVDMQNLRHTSSNIDDQMTDLWDQSYRKAIARANMAIKYIPGIDMNEADKNRLIAEAKFFRAFAYLHLVRFFGDVPLVLEPYESLDNLYVERTPSSEVYAQIIQDAKEAAAVLPDKIFSANGFRITKAAAETVLANAYLQMSGYPLQQDNYKNAADAARSIINSGKHALITHVDGDQESAYNILRTEDDSREYIYSREYVEELADNDNGALPAHSMPNILSGVPDGMVRTIVANVYKPSDLILNAFNTNDLRVHEKQFWYKNYTYKKDGVDQSITFDQMCVWRFYDEYGLYESTKSGKDINIYRYPEVLLIAAEAIARSEGVTAEAVGYLADVRARAFVYPGSTSGVTRASIVAELSGLSVDKFVEEVWTERLRELAIDFKVWDDIQRTRKYPKTSASNPGKVEWVNVIGATNPFGATYKEEHLLWPISFRELQRNRSLTQNPGF